MSVKMFKHISFHLFILLLFSDFFIIQAQEYGIIHYGIEDGLSSSQVLTLFQDSKGYLWVSTDAGLDRFDGEKFEHFTAKDGLFNASIASIQEDLEGNLWFKKRYRNKELLKFDGRKFQQIPQEQLKAYGVEGSVLAFRDQYELLWLEGNNSLTYAHAKHGIQLKDLDKHSLLKHNYIYTIFSINDKEFYLGTMLGFLHYQNGQFTNLSKAQGLRIQAFQIIRFQNRYALLSDEGLMFFDGTNLSNENVPPALQRNIAHNMVKDSYGHLWIATVKGLYYFDGQEFTHFTSKDSLPNNRINRIFIDSRNLLWLSTDGGLVVYDGTTFRDIDKTENRRFANSRDKWSITYRQIVEDHEGSIWFNTSEGIAKLSSFDFIHYTKDKPLKTAYIKSILKDSKKNLWVGYLDEGLSCYQMVDGEKKIIHYGKTNGLLSERITALLEDTKGQIWVGTSKGLLQYNSDSDVFQEINLNQTEKDPQQDFFDEWHPKQDPTDKYIGKLLLDKKGYVWIAMQYGIHVYNGRSFAYHTIEEGKYPFQAIHIDKNGDVWAYAYQGLYRFNRLEDKFDLVGNRDYLGAISKIDSDDNGNLWMINRKGLVLYNGRSATTFTELEGLTTNRLYSILVHKDYAWLPTPKGIDRFDITTYLQEKKVRVRHFDKADGFTPLECTQLVYKDKEGHLWFGTKKGITAYHPPLERVDYDEKRQAILEITEIKLGYETVDWIVFADSLDTETGLPQNLRLQHDENTLTFEYRSLTFGDASQIRYQQRLVGYDENWQISTQKTTITYPNLPAGNYTFQVKATDVEGNWLRPITFSFQILPAFWQETQFRVYVIGGFLILLFFLWLLKIWLFRRR